LREGIIGDFVETGIWRGGCGILMRAVLAAASDVSRNVWLFDSFQGLPKPDVQAFPQDEPDRLWTFNNYLCVSVEEVKANLKRFNLLDERTQFVAGWFRDRANTSLSSGGFIIVDDYALQICKAAVDDFRSQHSIDSAITEIDWSGIFWRKPGKSRLARSNNRARIRLLAAKFRA
jgi:O-methyltransferase